MKKPKTETAPTATIDPWFGVKMIGASEITIDPDFNARHNIDPKAVREIAASVQADGQLQPIVVIRQPGKAENYFLLAGFTRFVAICGPEKEGGLGRKEIEAKILEDRGLSKEDLYFKNLAENIARRDLTTYDQAIRFHDLVKTQGLSGSKVAARTGLTPGYINNLVSIVSNACSSIVERWRDECLPEGHDERPQLLVCNQQWLLKVQKLDHESQIHALNHALGQSGQSDDAPDSDSEIEGNPAPVSANRAKLKHLQAALEACKGRLSTARQKKEEVEIARLQALIVCLQFAMGDRKDLPKVYEIPEN